MTSTNTANGTSLTSEAVVSWWSDWRTFLKLQLELHTLHARTLSTDSFDEDQDSDVRRVREIAESLGMIPSARRAVFEGELETQRRETRRELNADRDKSAAEVDLHAIERGAIEALIDIAEGDVDAGRLPAVPTERGAWFDVHPSVMDQVPSEAAYQLGNKRRGPSKNLITIGGLVALWTAIGLFYYFATRPAVTETAAAAPDATVNGEPLRPWSVRSLRLDEREIPVVVVASDTWPEVAGSTSAGMLAGSVWPMELCIPGVRWKPCLRGSPCSALGLISTAPLRWPPRLRRR